MIIFNYTVNYIDVMLAAIILLFIIVGYCRGLFINIVNFIRFSFALVLGFWAGEKLSGMVYQTYVKPEALEYINKNIVTSDNLDEVLKNLSSVGQTLPKSLFDSVDFTKLNVSGKELANDILENYFEPSLLLLTKFAIIVAVFTVFMVITEIIVAIFRARSKKRDIKRGRKSALKVADKILGAAFGALKGALAVFALVSILILVLDLYDETAQMSGFIEEVNSSQLLKLIDGINPFNAITGGLI